MDEIGKENNRNRRLENIIRIKNAHKLIIEDIFIIIKERIDTIR